MTVQLLLYLIAVILLALAAGLGSNRLGWAGLAIAVFTAGVLPRLGG